MTPPASYSLKNQVLDAVFGKLGTPEEQALAKAARPPRNVQTAFDILHAASFFSVLVLFLWRREWLPFMETRISETWLWAALGLNVLLRLVWEQITKHYERRAKARLADFA